MLKHDSDKQMAHHLRPFKAWQITLIQRLQLEYRPLDHRQYNFYTIERMMGFDPGHGI